MMSHCGTCEPYSSPSTRPSWTRDRWTIVSTKTWPPCSSPSLGKNTVANIFHQFVRSISSVCAINISSIFVNTPTDFCVRSENIQFSTLQIFLRREEIIARVLPTVVQKEQWCATENSLSSSPFLFKKSPDFDWLPRLNNFTG